MMRPPPFLLGAALLFWGWATGWLWIGTAAAIVIELPLGLKARWQFSQADLDRVWNLCVTLFLGATIYTFFSSESLNTMGELMRNDSPSARLATLNQSKRNLFELLQWLPLMFLPIALAQAYGLDVQMDLSTFSWWLRRKRRELEKSRGLWPARIHVGYPYFACCLFSACAGNERTLWFTAGLVGLMGWALWTHRSRSFSGAVWGASFVLALSLGAGLQVGMLEVQKLLQRLDETLWARWTSGRTFDAAGSQTRIGTIGKLKLSGRIVLRVETGNAAPPPLLRQASYDAFQPPAWMSSNHHFDPVTPETNTTTWNLHPLPNRHASARISGYLRGGRGVLSFPSGTGRFDHLPVAGMTTNRLGTVRVEEGPGFVQFDTAYEPGQSLAEVPTAQDREVPLREQGALREVAASLQLKGRSPRDQVYALERFFDEKFTYSLVQDERHRPTAERSPLARFLLEHRSGHCEYFATATVLMLRHLGIPARYATGFAVQEKKGRYYVVRERHAHAWCLAWIDGAWRDVDTTPAAWGAAEARSASILEPLADIFSRGWFEFSKWRWGHAEWKRYLLWLIFPLLAFAVGKIFLQKQWSRAGRNGRSKADSPWPGLDSEFYQVERRLNQAGFSRLPGEAPAAWLERLERSGAQRFAPLQPLVRAHYQLRFDPKGLTAKERAALRDGVQAWLTSFSC